MIVPMKLAAAARQKLLRAAQRGSRVGPDDLEGHHRHRSLTGRRFPLRCSNPPRTAASRPIAGKSFEIAPKAPRESRTLISLTKFANRKPGSGENQHVVAADLKQ